MPKPFSKTMSIHPDTDQEDPAMPTANAPAMLADHARLTADLTAINRELSAVTEARETAERDHRAALERQRQAAAQVERRLADQRLDPAKITHAIATDREVIATGQEVDAAATAIQAANARDKALMDRLRATEHALATLRGGSLADLLLLEEQFLAAQQEEIRLQGELDTARNTVAPELPDLAAIDREMLSVMVKAQLGEVDAAAVSAMEQRRAAALREHAEASGHGERSAALIASLTTRLTEARERLATLQEHKRVTLVMYGRNQLEQAAAEYREAAQHAFDAHGRMTAFARLVGSLDVFMAREITGKHSRTLRASLELVGAGEGDLKDSPARRERAYSGVVAGLSAAGVRM